MTTTERKVSFPMDKSRDIVVFSRPREEYYFVKYAGKFGVLAMIIISIIQMLFFPTATIPPIRWVFVILFFIFLDLLIKMIFRRFAYRLLFNPALNEVSFLLYRSKKPLTVNTKGINRIHINVYITFVLEREKLFYNGVVNRDLIAFLKTQLKVPITCGRLVSFIHKWW